MTILVTGASGTIGSDVIAILARTRGQAVYGLVRNKDKADAVTRAGATPLIGNFEDRDSLDTAMQGVGTVVLITAANTNAADQAAAVLASASAQGVKRIVRISALKAAVDGPTDNTRLHGRTERDLAGSGLAHVIIRPNLFMQNMLLASQSISEEDRFFFGMGDGRMGMIDTRDVAQCAAACALSSAHDGKTIQLTGPKAISFGEVADILTDILDRRIAYIPVTPDNVYQTIAQSGWGEWLAGTMRDYATAYRQGLGDFTTDGVRQITGTQPVSFEQFAREVLVPAFAESTALGTHATAT